MECWQKDIDCNKVRIQSYDCSYHIYLPWKSPRDCENPLVASIDKCLLPEILSLWEMGIKTTGCCCGHGVQTPYIGVTKEGIQKMKNLGYEVHFNSCRPGAEDSFIPKTELSYEKSKCTEV